MNINRANNAAIMSLGAFFIAAVPTVYHEHPWVALVSAIVGVACFVIYDIIPA